MRGDSQSRAAHGPAHEVTLLERLLASEGRNALSRVELAASELARGEWPPVFVERILSIREAVAELDGVFEKLERLARPAREGLGAEASEFASVWQAVSARVGPVLAVRGIRLVAVPAVSCSCVAMPATALERILLLALRTLAAAWGEEARGRAPTISIVPRMTECEAMLEIGLLVEGVGTRPTSERVARGARLELDVALAEWNGISTVRPSEEGLELGLHLPRSGSDA